MLLCVDQGFVSAAGGIWHFVVRLYIISRKSWYCEGDGRCRGVVRMMMFVNWKDGVVVCGLGLRLLALRFLPLSVLSVASRGIAKVTMFVEEL